MPRHDESISILSETECWGLLASVPLGRLVTSVGGQPEIFPVNYVVDRRGILFRTSEGTKLISAAVNERVLFEVDQHNVAEGWSVIVKGTARTLRDEELEHARLIGLSPWTSPTKDHFVRIRPTSVTGRRFAFRPATSEELAARAL